MFLLHSANKLSLLDYEAVYEEALLIEVSSR